MAAQTKMFYYSMTPQKHIWVTVCFISASNKFIDKDLNSKLFAALMRKCALMFLTSCWLMWVE